MVEAKKGASYLDRRMFNLPECLDVWGPRLWALLIVGSVFLIYLILAAAYLGMSIKPSALNVRERADGIIISRNEQKHFLYNNKDAGALLVITGLAFNGFSEARRHIKLKGRIFSPQGDVIDERYVYAGNIVSKEDLGRLPLAEIFLRLANKNGLADSNLNVPQGDKISFMVVFENPPKDEYVYLIEPAGSHAAHGSRGAADAK